MLNFWTSNAKKKKKKKKISVIFFIDSFPLILCGT